MKGKQRFISRLSCFLLLAAICFCPLYGTDVEFPLVQSLSYFPYSDPEPLEKGVLSFGLDWHYSNIYMFNREHTILNDFEVSGITLGFRYGLMRGGTVEVYLRHTSIFGGRLDKFIEDFHRTFKLPHNNREEYPRNAVHYWYKDRFAYTGGKSAVSPLVVSFLKEIFQGRGLRLSGRVSLGIPLSKTPGFSSGKFFLTAGVESVFRFKWLKFTWSNYLSFFQAPGWLNGEKLRSNIFYSRLELRAFGFLGGFIFRSAPFKEDDVAHHAWQGFIGFRVFKNLEFIVMEDFEPFDTTPDVSFLLRWRFSVFSPKPGCRPVH